MSKVNEGEPSEDASVAAAARNRSKNGAFNSGKSYSDTSYSDMVDDIATIIIDGFDQHLRIFNEHTRRVAAHFEHAQWDKIQLVSKSRIQAYDKRVAETCLVLSDMLARDSSLRDEGLWQRVRSHYASKLKAHLQPKLAESFYNSVFCRLHHRRYFNNDNIFVRSSLSFGDVRISSPIINSYECRVENIQHCLKAMILDFGFTLGFEDIDRDIVRVRRRYLKNSRFDVSSQTQFRFDVINRPFYRSKAAYIIGRIVTDYGDQAFSIPILNNQGQSLYLDTLILDVDELNVIFGFARAYFMVETQSPAAMVSFLQRLLLRKSRTELYTHIGFQKHGKTQFYREFLEHLENSTDKLVEAPGVEGMVMAVFTLPSFPYVFKMIKDKFPPEKDTTEEEIKNKYMLVKLHDRVGRMADTLEYSEVALPHARFSDALYRYLKKVVPSKISREGQSVILKHIYIERRMTPLNIYLQECSSEQRREALHDYGYAIKHMIAVNIFPGDMLLKNFGVSRHGRVVFYDYDEVEYLTQMKFRKIPPARNEEDEYANMPWYHVGPYDVFPEQFLKFVLVKKEYREPFLEKHADLLDADYWTSMQNAINGGMYPDVFPYPESTRFCNENQG